VREYNPEADYPFLLEAAAIGKCLVHVRAVFDYRGISWPPNFNQSPRAELAALDHDICMSWGCGPNAEQFYKLRDELLARQGITGVPHE
jgi:hypothetical protein